LFTRVYASGVHKKLVLGRDTAYSYRHDIIVLKKWYVRMWKIINPCIPAVSRIEHIYVYIHRLRQHIRNVWWFFSLFFHSVRKVQFPLHYTRSDRVQNIDSTASSERIGTSRVNICFRLYSRVVSKFRSRMKDVFSGTKDRKKKKEENSKYYVYVLLNDIMIAWGRDALRFRRPDFRL